MGNINGGFFSCLDTALPYRGWGFDVAVFCSLTHGGRLRHYVPRLRPHTAATGLVGKKMGVALTDGVRAKGECRYMPLPRGFLDGGDAMRDDLSCQ